MDPIAFTIGKLTIRWYGVFAAIGFIAGVGAAQLKRKHANMTADQVGDVALYSMVSGILGARIFYVIQFWDQFRGNIWEVVRIDHGGLVFYGGFICAIITLFTYCHVKKLSFVNVLDLMALGVSVGHVFGRIGCFLNGCCYGKPGGICGLSVVYPESMPPGQHYPGVPLHPVQLYEALGNLILFAVLFYLTGKVKKGQIAALYLGGYAILRFCDEFFRGDHEDFILGGLTPGQCIAVACALTSVIAFGYIQKKSEKKPKVS